MTRLSVSVLSVAIATACESPQLTGGCPPGYLNPQVVVAVTDSVSGKPIALIARGAVYDASGVDSLGRVGVPATDSLHITAQVFRASVYSVSVQAPGYAAWLRGGVAAPAPGSGPCPTPSNVNIGARLQPLP